MPPLTIRPPYTPIARAWHRTRATQRLRIHAQRRGYRSVNDDTVRSHNVRFQRPSIFSRTRFTRLFLWSAAFYIPLRLFVVPHIAIEFEEASPEVDEKTGAQKKQPGTGVEVTEDDEEDEDEEEMEEGDIFIPFTRAVELPRKYYKGSDPEWQEFLRVAQDTERQTTLCNQLKTTLLQRMVGKMGLRRSLGSNIVWGKHWIDFIFPDGPPPDYSRDGLIFGNGRLVWGSEVVDDATYRRQSKLVWPKEAIDSAMFSGRIMLQLGYQQAMALLGYKANNSSPYARDLAQVQQAAKIYQLQAQRASAGADGNGTDDALARASQQQSNAARPWPLSAFSGSPFAGAPQSESDKSSLGQMSLFTWSTLTLGFMRSQRQQKREPPRGTFIMHGLVEIRGSRGRMLLDVRAVYNPKDDVFVDVAAGLRNYKPWAQKPKGGA